MGGSDVEAGRWWPRLLRQSESLVFDQPLWHLLVAVGVLDLVKNGMWVTPGLADWASMAKAFPAEPKLAGMSSWILSSPVGPAVAHYLGATSPSSFEVFSVVAVVIAVATLSLGLRRAAGSVAQRIGLVALFASPLSNILMTWIGKEDPFVILFASVVFLFDSPLVVLFAAMGLATANPEAGAAVVGGTVLLRGLDPLASRRALAAAVAGFSAGLLLLAGYGAEMGVPMGGRLSYVEHTGAKTLVTQFLSELPTLLFTVFGAWWVAFIAFWQDVIDRRRTASAVIGFLVVCGAVSAASVDQSRIFALVSFPALLWSVCAAARLVPAERLRLVTTWIFLVAAVVPRTVVQGGSTYVSHMSWILQRSF